MDLNDVIKAKIEMENSIRDATCEAMKSFEKETGITPSTINIHLAHEERITPGAPIELYSQIRYYIIGVEATITL